MINHARTLLLNKSSITAGISTGYTAAEYIESSFNPIILPVELNKMYSIIYSGRDIEDQLNITKGLMSILHLDLLQPYTLIFDDRITYTNSSFDLSVSGLSFSIIDMYNTIDKLLYDPNILHDILKGSGSVELYNIWSQSQEIPIRLGSILLAYISRVEDYRK